MEAARVASVGEYIDHLEVHPDEFSQLFNSILINVTSFFRDDAAWDKLSRDVVPAILASKGADDPIRVWSAGCASGEEAYTLAMVWAEALGLDQFRERVKIYASDLDGASALVRARQGTYSSKELDGVSEELRQRYFERAGNRFAFRSDLRRSVIFGHHNLIQDAPISRLDLLVCRNTLMYFNAETQARILARFHFALNEQGYLFLGKAEMLLSHSHLFQPVDLKSRIFVKAPNLSLRDRLFVLAQVGDQDAGGRLARHIRLRDETFNLLPIAQLAVDLDGALVLANERARILFGLTPRDLGRPFHDLEVSYRPVELRSLIEKVETERTTAHLPAVERAVPGGGIQFLDVHVVPIRENDGTFLGASIVFDDVTEAHRMRAELLRSSQELETAYEELRTSNEELETTNEELQSTVEELQTTNEELQATNDEHETMNEELQSTNQELQTVNEELRGRTEELNHANAFLRSILASLRGAVAVVDRDLNVLMWNPKAEDLWGVRFDEVEGRSFLRLDIGLPTGRLLESIRAAFRGSHPEELTVEATNRRGRPMQCRVTCTGLRGPGEGDVQGALILMEGLPAAQ
jgi:two-component system, chemotaxis family, CheB/CheR fusion protein